MKTNITILALLLSSFLFFNCSIDNQEEAFGDTSERFIPTNQNCEGEEPLIAGQNYPCGLVNTKIVGDNMVITYSTDNGWEITKTHLFIGKFDDIPTNQPGNPRIGQFPYKSTEVAGTTQVTWTIPTASLILEDGTGYVAAHADVSLFDSNGTLVQSETAWGEGDPLPGNSWAMAFYFDLGVLANCPN